jgi:hypothetical protein
MVADRCGFCGSLDGPFTPVEACSRCWCARRVWPCGPTVAVPFPDLTDKELQAGLDLLPTWALEAEGSC